MNGHLTSDQECPECYDCGKVWDGKAMVPCTKCQPTSDPLVNAQHDETGRWWSGPRSQIPPCYSEVPETQFCPRCGDTVDTISACSHKPLTSDPPPFYTDAIEAATKVLAAQEPPPSNPLRDDARDAARYRWLRQRIEVRNQQAMSGSVRPGIEVRVGCSYFDSNTVARNKPRDYTILDRAIDEAIGTADVATVSPEPLPDSISKVAEGLVSDLVAEVQLAIHRAYIRGWNTCRARFGTTDDVATVAHDEQK